MNAHGKMIAPDTIRFERLLPGPVSRVWEYITDAEKRRKWLAKGEMELSAGGEYTLYFKHAELSDEQDTPPEKYREMVETGHSFSGTVLQCDPPHLIAFTWGDGSEVTIELREQNQDNAVLLILTHRKLSPKANVRISVASGWHTHLGILAAVLNGVSPKGFWEIHNQMEKEYEGNV